MVCLRSITDNHNMEGDQHGCWREHGTVICTRDAKDQHRMAGLVVCRRLEWAGRASDRGGGVCAETALVE